MAITKITDHADQALLRFKELFKDKPKYVAFLSIFVEQIQDLEDAWWQLLTERWIDAAEGDQLDDIGLIVGYARGGLSDDDYRPYLRSKILVNKSKARYADVLAVARAMLAGEEGTPELIITPEYPAALTLEIASPEITDELATALIAFLRDTVAAGVRILLHYSVSAPGTRFRFAHSTFADGALTATDTAIPVDSTAGFPATGSIILDQGTADEETVDYAGLTATSFFGTDPLTNNHDDNTQVALVRDSLGFDQGKFTSVVA